MDGTTIRNRDIMKKIVFIADFYSEELPGGGESNDLNLIKFLGGNNDVHCYKSKDISVNILNSADSVIVSNFVMLSGNIKDYLINNKKYIIYEHDHKYVSTRDPSEFFNFEIPEQNIINKRFYESSYCTVVLSKVCKEVLKNTLPDVRVENIGCSLWSEEKFTLLEELSTIDKNGKTCIMASDNPTKNYHTAVTYCMRKDIQFEPIANKDQEEFLKTMATYSTLVFVPKVLETFSRLCAEAKMMNLKVMTNKKLIGFYSEECVNLSGLELIEELRKRNKSALKLFEELL